MAEDVSTILERSRRGILCREAELRPTADIGKNTTGTAVLELRRFAYSELSSGLRENIEALCWDEFGQYEIVRNTEWARPDYTFAAFDQGELAGFYNLVLRSVSMDEHKVPVAGINNVVTLAGYRGRGIATQLLGDTESYWFETLGTEHGLLLCADALLTFYERLGWYKVRSTVRFSQSDGTRTWSANCMLRTPGTDDIKPSEIDLCGEPW